MSYQRLLLCAIGLTCAPAAAFGQLQAERVSPGTSAVAYVSDPATRDVFGNPEVFYEVFQSGYVFVSQTPNAFVDLRHIVSTGAEQGLLGMAFPPDAATSGYVFFSFTDVNGDLVISRFTRTFGGSRETPRVLTDTRLDL